jgi:hypothetical protein
MHLLVGALLALAIGRSALVGSAGWPAVVTCSVAVAVAYAIGQRSKAVTTSVSAAGAWLAVLLTAWVGLLILTSDAIYLAFPWFFLLLYLLPRYAGLTGVLLTTIAAIIGFGWHQETFTFAMVVGPVLGAAAAVPPCSGTRRCRPSRSSGASSSSSWTAREPSCPRPNTGRECSMSGNGWHARYTTPSRRA